MAEFQFPKGDTPYAEDMGRAAKRWQITGYVIGDDYTAPFRCNVPIRRVVVDVAGEHDRDPMAVFQALMSEQ